MIDSPSFPAIIVIGASLGGIEALTKLLAPLPADFPASLLIVIHVHPHSPSMMDRMLQSSTSLNVKFPQEGEVLQKGTVYLAPPDQHLLIQENRIMLTHGPRENRARPAIDPLFRSAAVEGSTRVIGIILTGLLDDGTAGMAAVKLCGGTSIVQNDAAHSEMPASVLAQVETDYSVPLAEIPALLQRLVATPVMKQVEVPTYLRKEVEISQGLGDAPMEANIIGKPSSLTCPDCGGSITEIEEENLVRYRCHEGHAYGPLSIINAQTEKLEYALWSAVRMLEEQGSMLRRIGRRSSYSRPEIERYEDRAKEMHGHALRIKDFLINNMQQKI